MQIIITDYGQLRSRVMSVSLWRLMAGCLTLLIGLVAGTVYLYDHHYAQIDRHGVIVGTTAPVPDEASDTNARMQEERYLQENLDVMARRLGEIQARLVQLESIGERISGLAGLTPQDIRAADPELDGAGGLLIDGRSLSLEQLASAMLSLDEATQQSADMFTVIESRLFEQKMRERMIPSERPVSEEVKVGSGFGFRRDPFTRRNALHSGLDFPAPAGTPILAAAGGLAIDVGRHPAYGLMIDLDHGNGLVTRYAHASKLFIKKGDLVKPGQKIAAVGSTGRSTGPHLHFEVLVDGVPQNPMKFLAGNDSGGKTAAAQQAR